MLSVMLQALQYANQCSLETVSLTLSPNSTILHELGTQRKCLAGTRAQPLQQRAIFVYWPFNLQQIQLCSCKPSRHTDHLCQVVVQTTLPITAKTGRSRSRRLLTSKVWESITFTYSTLKETDAVISSHKQKM